MTFRTLLCCIAVFASRSLFGQEVAWTVFVLLVFLCFENLKKALFEVPGALNAIVAALRGEDSEVPTHTPEAHLLRLDLNGRTIVIRCAEDGWRVKMQGVEQQHVPRHEGAWIEINT